MHGLDKKSLNAAVFKVVSGIETIRYLGDTFSFALEKLNSRLGPIAKLEITGSRKIAGYSSIISNSLLLNPVPFAMPRIANTRLGITHNDTNSTEKYNVRSLPAIRVKPPIIITLEDNASIVVINTIRTLHVNSPPNVPLVVRIAHLPCCKNFVIPSDAANNEIPYEVKNNQ